MNRLKMSTAVAVVSLTLAGSAWAQRYKVVELPIVRTPDEVTSVALNEVGGATVNEYWVEFRNAAEVCGPSGCQRMPLLPNHGKDPWTEANDINDAGAVAGTTSERGLRRAVLLQDGVLTNLGPLADGKKLESLAEGINNLGDVVGYGQIQEEKGWRGFHWKDGVMTILPTLGGSYGRAVAINDAGVTVGVAKTANDRDHAFMLKDGTITDLGTLGGKESFANAINAHGDVVGTSDLAPPGNAAAFLYRGGVMSSLGALPGHAYSGAAGINDAGEIVGVSDRSLNIGDERGFLHDTQGMRDLNDLLRASDRKLYTVKAAYGINNRGDIAARAERKADRAEMAVILKRID